MFPHVGTNTQIEVRGKRIWPLVTGTFGGTDFLHSLLGEATDKISQTSLTDLDSAVTEAEMKSLTDTFSKLKTLLSIFPSGQSDLDNIHEQTKDNQGKKFRLEGMSGEGAQISVQDLEKKVYPILEFHDTLMQKITSSIEMVTLTYTLLMQGSWPQ